VLSLDALITELLGDALWSVFTEATFDCRRDDKGRLTDLVRSAIARDASRLTETIRGATDDIESIQEFLESPDVAAFIVRLFQLAELQGGVSHSALNNPSTDVRVRVAFEAFAEMLAASTGKPGHEVRSLAAPLFAELTQITHKLLVFAASEGHMEALTAVVRGDVHRIDDLLKVIAKELSLLRDPDVDERAVRSFEAAYANELRSRHSKIDLEDVTQISRVELDSIYVAPTLALATSRSDEAASAATRSLGKLVNESKRTVVLGNPGTGKTTLTDRLCVDICSSYAPRNRATLPIWVSLRELHASGLSLLDYIDDQAKRKLELAPLPRAAFERLLVSGRALLIFDGLDEVLDRTERIKIRDRVESICRHYPDCQVFVTSRIVGYREAPLEASLFNVASILPFAPEQVSQYAEKWFRLVEHLSSAAESQARAFLEEAADLGDLLDTPLLLSLLCALYREEHAIPRQRAEVYERCARLLFERWDSKRKIATQLPASTYVKELVQHLATWMYESQERQGGVSESELVAESTTFLDNRLFANTKSARAVAESFVTFLKGRAWILSGIGRQTGEEQYRFTHNTFRDYFAAEDLAFTYPEPTELLKQVLPHVRDGHLESVCKLAVQLQARRAGGVADVFVAGILECIESKTEQAGPRLMSFLFGALPALTPTPEISQRLARATVVYFAAGRHPVADPRQVISDIDLMRVEVQSTFTTRAYESIRIELAGGDLQRAMRAAELGSYIALSNASWTDCWKDELWELLRDLSERERSSAQLLFRLNVLSPRELVDLHGLAVLFEPTAPLSLLPDDRPVPPAAWLIVNRLFRREPNVLEEARRERELGELAPLFEANTLVIDGLHKADVHDPIKHWAPEHPNLDMPNGDALFAAIALCLGVSATLASDQRRAMLAHVIAWNGVGAGAIVRALRAKWTPHRYRATAQVRAAETCAALVTDAQREVLERLWK